MKAFASDPMLNNDIDILLGNLGEVNFRGKTVLVTGGAGVLGSWMCEVLVNRGAKVICLDNLSSGLEANIEHLLQNDNFQFMEQDITELLYVKDRVDLVLHLASRASPFEFETFPLEILRANTLGTVNALEIAREHKAIFLFASTSETYGNPAVVPTPESYYGYVNSIGIRGCYDESKRCGEAYVMAYRKQYGMDVRIARIFNTYGPRMRPDGIYGRAIPRFISQALRNEPITVFGDGKQTRSFCYITDQIEGLLRLAFTETARGEVVNIGNDEEITVIDLAKMVKKLAGSSSNITFGLLPQDDPQRRCPDITKAKQILGWRPKVKLEDGLRKTIKWLSEVGVAVSEKK
jgi:UDP-glucuronate decarboxylase